MEKAQILDRIRNKLTLPRVLFQKLEQLSTQYPLAIQSIDELIEEINPHTKDADTRGKDRRSRGRNKHSDFGVGVKKDDHETTHE